MNKDSNKEINQSKDKVSKQIYFMDSTTYETEK